MLVSIALLVVGLVLLVKGADWLVSGSSSLARAAGVSDLVVGLTIVSFGTSMPEFIVTLLAVLRGEPGLAIGNVVGSNIANVLLILGVAAVIYPLFAVRGTVWKEIPFMVLAALVLWFTADDRLFGNGEPVLTRGDGLVLLGFFAIFLYYVALLAVSSKTAVAEDHTPAMPTGKAVLFVGLGLGFLIGGGQMVVTAAVDLATMAGVSPRIVGLTIVAVGTSLPELATSAVAAWKKNSEIAIGNVVGSNIFNVFFILGSVAVISPIPFSTTNVEMAFVVGSSVALFLALLVGKPRHQVQRVEGAVFVLAYAGFLAYLAM